MKMNILFKIQKEQIKKRSKATMDGLNKSIMN